jgi:sugar phosphate isomerase/epimerase
MQPSLSTMWIQHRFDNLSDFFAAGNAMGFTQFELGHVVRPEMFRGVQPGEQTISSIHAPCPVDPGPWDYLASLDEGKRKQAVAQAKDTIALAQKLKARVVVLHIGKAAIDPSLERRLRDLYNQGKKDTQEYEDTKRRLVEARARVQAQNLAAAAKSLDELSQHAQVTGVKLGLENRYHYYEVPNLEEMGALLTPSDPATVFYWHDTGHAQNLENLGFTRHEEWLRAFASRMVGVHLHDILGLKDHRVAGMGQMNWSMIASYLPAQAIRTCEFDWPYSEEEIVAGVEYLRQMGCL